MRFSDASLLRPAFAATLCIVSLGNASKLSIQAIPFIARYFKILSMAICNHFSVPIESVEKEKQIDISQCDSLLCEIAAFNGCQAFTLIMKWVSVVIHHFCLSVMVLVA